jgi:two-component system, NarL family, nitrate/nitrite response regulator NarL
VAELSKPTTPTVIVASSVLLREGLVSLLLGTSYKVVSAVGGPEGLAHHELTGRALAILAIDRQNGNHTRAAESIRLLRSLMPVGKIVLVSEMYGLMDLQGVAALAPDGYIFNVGSRDMLVKLLELIFMDQQIFVLARSIAAPPNGGNDTQRPGGAVDLQSGSSYEFGKKTHGIQLSHRERQVLMLVAHGEPNKGIARACAISEATVKCYLKAILHKTNVQNRTQAAIWATNHGLANTDVGEISSRPADSILADVTQLPRAG